MNYPKKLKKGDEVIVKLATTHLRYHSWHSGYIRGTFKSECSEGTVIRLSPEIAPALGTETIVIDNTPNQQGYWEGIIIRYVGTGKPWKRGKHSKTKYKDGGKW